MGSLPLRVLIAGIVVVAMVVAGCVVLLLTGHAESAFDLPVIIAAFLPLVMAQLHTSNVTTDTNNKVDALLNGGGENAVRRVLDETVNPTLDSIAVATNATPAGTSSPGDSVTAQRLADAEAAAQKSRP